MGNRKNKEKMSKKLQHTIIGYFRFFYDAMGNKLLVNIFLSIILGFFDGLGIAMFIPLLQFVAGDKKPGGNEDLGGLNFVLEFLQSADIPLTLVSILIFMVLIFFIKGFLNYIIQLEQVDLRQNYMVSLRMKQINLLRNLSYKGFIKIDSGIIQNTITAEVGKNLGAMIQFLNTSKALVLLITYVFLAFLANWQFAFLLILGVLLTNFVFSKFNTIVKKTSIWISKRGNLFSGYIIQATHSFKYLKSTAHFSIFTDRIKKIIGEIETQNRIIGKYQAITLSLREPIVITVVCIVILIQVNYLGSTLGTIILSLLLFYRAMMGFMTLQTGWQTFMQNVGSLESIDNFNELLQSHSEDSTNGQGNYEGFTDNISLTNLNFWYREDVVVLKDVNLKIKKNSTIALVGESGSGKSTLANIIVGLIPPSEGKIELDSKNLYDLNLDTYRGKVGYITQEAVVFNDNIYNNITFWQERTPENIQKFESVLRQVSLWDFVQNLPEKENTELGDNGILISGGQKQRISIARELYKELDIIIFDEATAALDSETERFIQSSIDDIQGKCTMVIIAHRLSTIKNADEIFLMEKGEIVASGNFEELQQKSDKFRRMVMLQNLNYAN